MGLPFVEVGTIQDCVEHSAETGYCAIPLFHGTRLHALTEKDEDRERFRAACKQVISFARNLLSDTVINASALKEYQLSKNQLFLDAVTIQQKNSFYQHGDFYLTSGYPRAITFTKHAGGELGQWAYHQCLGFEDFNIPLDQQTADAVKVVFEEHQKYQDSEKVVLVYQNVKFDDLRTEGGDPYLFQSGDENQNEAINTARLAALYKSNVTDHSGRQINFRLVNPEAYTAQLIHQEDLKVGFAVFTKVTDVERYIREKRLGI
jgi:hypothetical protein